MRLRLAGAASVAAAASLAGPAAASACGIPFDDTLSPKVDAERALITFDGRRQELITRLDVRTSGKGAAVLLPVPSTPRVRAVPKGLFGYLGTATAPRIRTVHYPGPPRPPSNAGAGGSAGEGGTGGGATEVSRREVGAYDVAVLKARTVLGLREYLDDNGFRISREGTTVLRRYVARGWRFVAIKPRAALPARARLAPLGISFATKKIVYPTSHGTLSRSPLDLAVYTLTAHRMRLGSLKTEFAGRVDALSRRPPKRFRTLLRRAPYLTKLGSPVVASAALERDLVAKRAATDAPFREIKERIVFDLPPDPPPPRDPCQVCSGGAPDR